MAITTETFAANTTWTVPAGVFSVTVHAIGGGGGGGGGDNANGAGGGGGGGGEYASIVQVTTPGQQYTITIGTGGAGAPTRNNDGSPGTATSFAALCIANGGAGGIQLPNGGGGGAGGTGGTGTTTFNGGTGGAGSASNCGGGGGAAGTTGPGGNGSGITAGTGTSLYGGSGGEGHTLANSIGNPGLVYGGAGSGSTRNSAAGNGADGYVVLEYEIIGGPKPFEPTSNTTVESSESVVTTVAQIDLAVVSNASLDASESPISNGIEFLGISADTSVDSSEAVIENGTFFIPTCAAAVDSTEATILASNVFYPSANTTLESTDFELQSDHAFYVTKNARVSTTEAVVNNSIEFLPSTPATVQSSESVAFNYVNILTQALDASVDSSESAIVTLKDFTTSISTDSLTNNATLDSYSEFSFRSVARASSSSPHVYEAGDLPFSFSVGVSTTSNISTLLIVSSFAPSCNAIVESTDFNVSNENLFSGISLGAILATEEAFLDRLLDDQSTISVIGATSLPTVTHITDLSTSFNVETSSSPATLTGWSNFSFTADTISCTCGIVEVFNRLDFTASSFVISTVSAETEVGYNLEFSFNGVAEISLADSLLSINGSMYIHPVAKASTASFPLKHVRRNTLSFKRYTKVYMKQGKNIWELPILSDFKFSQAAIQKEVTQNQLGHASTGINRGREVYTESIDAANWSFKTYMRPFIANPTLKQWEGSVPRHHAVEEALWANLVQDNARDAYSWKKRFVEDVGLSIAKPVSTTSDLKFDFEFSNTITTGKFDLYFALAGCETSAKTPVTYKISNCIINEAKIDFDLEGIASIDWSGFGTDLVEPTQAELDSLSAEDMLWYTEGIESTTNLIPARLTRMFATSYPDEITAEGVEIRTTFPGSDGVGTYNLPLTAGSLVFSNNISHVFRDDIYTINKANYLIGTRSIGGNFTTYLSNTVGSSKQLFKEILDNTYEQSPFDLKFVIGDVAGQRVELSFPRAILNLPKHNIDDVIEVETEFAALPSRFDEADEAYITYVAV